MDLGAIGGMSSPITPKTRDGRHVKHQNEVEVRNVDEKITNAPVGRKVVHHYNGMNVQSEPKTPLGEISDPQSISREEERGTSTASTSSTLLGYFSTLFTGSRKLQSVHEERGIQGSTIHDLERGVRTGQKTNSDGNTYRLPTIEAKFVDKIDYIPDEIARAKIALALREYEVAKGVFERRIEYIEEHTAKNKAERETYFKRYAQELKENATRHVEIQRELKRELEKKLTQEIHQKEDLIHQLEDSVQLLTDQGIEKDKQLDSLSQEMAVLSKGCNELEGILGAEAILSSVDEAIYRKELDSFEGKISVHNALQTIIYQLELREAKEEASILRRAHEKALEVAKKAEESASKAEDEANEFIINKLADIEGESRQKFEEELAVAESEKHHKIEQMKALLGTEIDRQKAEIATLKTKYIAEKFQFNAVKSRFNHEKDRLSTLIERGQVHLVLNDMVSSVLLNSEQARSGRTHHGRHVKRSGSGKELYRQTSRGRIAQFGGLDPIESSKKTEGDRYTEEDLYRVDEEFAGDLSSKRAPDKERGEWTIQQIFERAKAEVADCSEQYSLAVDNLKNEKNKRRDAKAALKDWLTAFEKENGRPANMEDRKSAQHLFVSLRSLTKSTETLENKKEEALERKIEAERSLTMVKDQMSELGVDIYEFRGSDLDKGSNDKGHRKITHHPEEGSHKNRKVQRHEEGGDEPGLPSDRVFQDVETEASIRVDSMKNFELNIGDGHLDGSASQPQLSPRGEAFREDAGGHTALQRQITTHIEDKAELSEKIEALGDEVYLLKEQLKSTEENLTRANDEKNFARKQLDDMVKEKRTDVIAHLSEETERLKEELSNSVEEMARLRSDATKADLKVKEWANRAKTAEDELALRDENEAAKLDPGSERAKLLEQLQKQREDVKNKGKAATAGWNAAATADEKLEVVEEKRFNEGYNQAKKDLARDNSSMIEQLEKKETRITELMVQLQEHEKIVREADKRVADAEERAKEVQQEAADTVAMFGSGNGSGDSDGGASLEEVERLEEELDKAHEEIVALTDQLVELQEQAEVSKQTISVLEQLQKVQRNQGDGNRNDNKDDKGRGGNHLDELVSAAKNAMSKGTSLWKAGKRKECGDVYLEVTQHIINSVFASDLKRPLMESIQGAKSADKSKTAVILRKALDKFTQDAKNPSMRRADSDANSENYVGKDSTKESPIVKQLQEELASLKEKLEFINVEKEKAVREAVKVAKEEAAAEAVSKGQSAEEQAASEAEAVEAAQKAVSASKSNSPNGMLLKRAKDAEKQVETLKRQMAKLAANMQAPNLKGATLNTGVDPAKQAIEIRRLQRRIKQLESGGGGSSKSGGGGGGNAGGDDREMKEMQKKLIASEKAAAKKYKELENSTKKEIRALESRANKAEKSLKKMSDESGPIKDERDKLKAKVTELLKLGTEVESLRQQASKATELAEANSRITKELDRTIENLKKETLLRKKYKNTIEDMKGAIRVYARCRPMAAYEKEKGCDQVVNFTSDETLTVQSDRGEKEFTFDQVFTPQSKQEEVFEDTRMLVESCLDGYNVCLFAYGQTGSGKTFTMTGSPTLPGLTPRAIEEIFSLIKEKTHLTVKVSTYFVELYLDSLVDLYYSLDNKGKKGNPPRLDIKLDAKKMVYINNCTIKEAETPEELMDLFNRGNLERHVGATKMNAESSRSHSIFAILIESYDPSTKRTTTGKLSLVDLAGSERADKTGATADRLKEGMAINKSLSALGDVISALSSGEKFIPYRNSKLTQMMQDSLGGNAKTLMFVNFSPADYNADETVTSLKYAARVKLITNDAAKAAESEEVSKLKAALRKAVEGGALGDDEVGLIK